MQILKSKSGNFIKAGLKRIYLPDNLDPASASVDELVALLGIESGKKKK
jgi:topoisomerase IA-like protein